MISDFFARRLPNASIKVVLVRQCLLLDSLGDRVDDIRGVKHQDYVFIFRRQDVRSEHATEVYVTQAHVMGTYWRFDLTGPTGQPGHVSGQFAEGPLAREKVPQQALRAVLRAGPPVEGLPCEGLDIEEVPAALLKPSPRLEGLPGRWPDAKEAPEEVVKPSLLEEMGRLCLREEMGRLSLREEDTAVGLPANGLMAEETPEEVVTEEGTATGLPANGLGAEKTPEEVVKPLHLEDGTAAELPANGLVSGGKPETPVEPSPKEGGSKAEEGEWVFVEL